MDLSGLFVSPGVSLNILKLSHFKPDVTVKIVKEFLQSDSKRKRSDRRKSKFEIEDNKVAKAEKE